jgi:uncharacterized protein
MSKLQVLKNTLSSMESALVAFSGGVDSTFLLKVAKDVLGDNVVAVTATSVTYPSHEVDDALKMVRQLGVRHTTIHTDEFSNDKFAENSKDRCYWCKKELFAKLWELAREYGLKNVLDGSNFDDTKDHRPGMKAGSELGVRSPLIEAELTKDEIRSFSKELGLQTWGKPSFACLSSRFPYGTRITEEGLTRVGKAEQFLRELGLSQLRVRHYNETARIEVLKEDMHRMLEEKTRNQVLSFLKNLGYTYITLDLEGFRTGSMNEVLSDEDKS